MKVFVTVGLETYPFDRLVEAVDGAVRAGDMPADTFVQHGRSSRAPTAAAGSEYLGHREMLERIAEADVVVAHAGVGTFLQCHETGKIPILVPRRHDLGEHVDDHQIAFANEMEKLGMAIVVRDTAELMSTVREFTDRAGALDMHAGESHSAPQLVAHIAELIDEHPRRV